MPELPDITLYLEHLERRIVGARLLRSNVFSPNLLRTFEPPLEAAFGLPVAGTRRIGKRIAIGLDGDLWLVLHLMIAGRLRWAPILAGASPSPAIGEQAPRPTRGRGKNALATFEFSTGTLSLTEASSKKRASLHVVRGVEGLRELDPGGIEPLEATLDEFRVAVAHENRTLKRALTDPRLVSGIGNAYSDEILHRARLSPMRQTRQLDDAEWSRLHDAVRLVLSEWIDRLRAEYGEDFPTHVTAFREGMAVHGRHRRPCPVCGAPVQRIVYAENEANYCARCQTGGRLMADRALSRLLRNDWPRRLEDLEAN
jgi:formamidopyrimidine-DNA glycosylase